MRVYRGVLLAAAATVAVVTVFAACGGSGDSGGNVPSYRLTVAFDSSVTQADMDQMQRFVHDYDPSAEMLLTESFPPTGHVIVKTNTLDFCGKIETLAEAVPSVASVTCEQSDGGGDSGG